MSLKLQPRLLASEIKRYTLRRWIENKLKGNVTMELSRMGYWYRKNARQLSTYG